MSKKKKRNSTPEERREAVRRHVVEGVPISVLALELGVQPSTVRGYVDTWERGFGDFGPIKDAWQWTNDEERGVALVALDRFVDRLTRVPTERGHVVENFRELAPIDRERLAPALDLYLHACELMDQVRELMKRASSIAAAELLADRAAPKSEAA